MFLTSKGCARTCQPGRQMVFKLLNLPISHKEDVYINCTLLYYNGSIHRLGFPHSSVSKESACNAEDLGSIPGSRSSPGEGNGNPLQYSCLEKPMDRGAWGLQPVGVTKKSDTTDLSDTNNVTMYIYNTNIFVDKFFISLVEFLGCMTGV